ncbi:hypothetical protein EST38_g6414 [Candolleomyces aberdarensis]|uniref:Uncharacterized protein n=1 Tax=Candolleomyces aberdarensis TaxID=2316362 RepID=A0A4Q2DJX0_9AGAR|nr:hypothetical protein EST38_g6414 [Candolleomyces aberdarensis]
MSLLIEQNNQKILSTSVNSADLHGIPAWGAPEVSRGERSDGGRSCASSTSAGSEDDEGPRNIARDEPSFITNEVCYANQRAHCVYAVRGSEALAKRIVFREAFPNVKYELVILHPKHFLPMGAYLPVYQPDGECAFYQVSSQDGTLRQAFSTGTTSQSTSEPASSQSQRLPPFAFDNSKREEDDRLNPLLIALAADIKFRRYARQGDLPHLEEHSRRLVEKTRELVELIYWRPEPAPPRFPPYDPNNDEYGSSNTGRPRAGRRNLERGGKEERLEDDYDDISLDEFQDMMSGPYDHDLNDDDRKLLDSIWN